MSLSSMNTAPCATTQRVHWCSTVTSLMLIFNTKCQGKVVNYDLFDFQQTYLTIEPLH